MMKETRMRKLKQSEAETIAVSIWTLYAITLVTAVIIQWHFMDQKFTATLTAFSGVNGFLGTLIAGKIFFFWFVMDDEEESIQSDKERKEKWKTGQ